MLYIWASAVTKISISVALLRLTVRKQHMIILYCLIGLTIANALYFFFILLLDCYPISYFWHQANPLAKGSCLSSTILLNIAYLYSALTIVVDFSLGILPIFLVWNLQMNRRTKFAVGGILSLGAMYVDPRNTADATANDFQCECCSGHSTSISSLLYRSGLSLYVISVQFHGYRTF